MHQNTRRIRGPRHGVATLARLRVTFSYEAAGALAAAVPRIVWRSGTPGRYLSSAEKRGGASNSGRIRAMRAADWPRLKNCRFGEQEEAMRRGNRKRGRQEEGKGRDSAKQCIAIRAQ
jgi:hypothetical protein